MISQLWICCPAPKTCFVSNYKAVSLFWTVFKSHDIYLTLITIRIKQKVNHTTESVNTKLPAVSIFL